MADPTQNSVMLPEIVTSQFTPDTSSTTTSTGNDSLAGSNTGVGANGGSGDGSGGLVQTTPTEPKKLDVIRLDWHQKGTECVNCKRKRDEGCPPYTPIFQNDFAQMICRPSVAAFISYNSAFWSQAGGRYIDYEGGGWIADKFKVRANGGQYESTVATAITTGPSQGIIVNDCPNLNVVYGDCKPLDCGDGPLYGQFVGPWGTYGSNGFEYGYFMCPDDPRRTDPTYEVLYYGWLRYDRNPPEDLIQIGPCGYGVVVAAFAGFGPPPDYALRSW